MMTLLQQKLFSIKVFNLEFSPRVLPTLAAIIVFPILLSLGFWQLHRGQTKQALESQFALSANSAPLNYQKAVSNLQKYQFHNIKVSGDYLNDKQLLLENRFHQHQLGYEVITPLKLPNNDVVLVNRGWIPGLTNNVSPTLSPVKGNLTITGRIIIPQQKIFKLGSLSYENQAWPRLIPNISWETIKQAMPNTKLSPFIIQLDPKSKNGFTREWKPVTLSPQKHFGYAVQWFAMAVTVLIIFITVNTRRRTSDE